MKARQIVQTSKECLKKFSGSFSTDSPSDQSSLLLDDTSLLQVEREGQLNLIVTISGIRDTLERDISASIEKGRFVSEFSAHFHFYFLFFQDISNTLTNLKDVGHLEVQIIKAEGILPEYVWKRNPLVVVEVGNKRLQTREDKGTITPQWNKTFCLYVLPRSFYKPYACLSF